MVVNRGVVPPNPSTKVGEFRLLIGDTSYVDLEPPEPGFGNYKMFSDDEIEVFLTTSDSIEGSIAFAYLQLAGAAALEAKSIQDMDLKIDTTARAKELRALALMWQDKADALSADIFEIFPTIRQGGFIHPEAAPWPIIRQRGCTPLGY